MNPATQDNDPLIEFYETDYPWPEDPCFPQLADNPALQANLSMDIGFVRDLAAGSSGPILDLCAGTGRLSVPLARAGHKVIAVEISGRQLERYANRLARESEDVRARATLVKGDICEVDLAMTTDFAFIGFNSLPCIASREDQMAAIRNAAKHLAPGGRLLLDVPNALQEALGGAPLMRPHMMRADSETRRRYVRVTMSTAADVDQIIGLYGWYDEMMPDNTLKRWMFWMRFRELFKSEIQFMLESAGLEIIDIYGNYARTPFTSGSPKMLVVARKPA